MPEEYCRDRSGPLTRKRLQLTPLRRGVMRFSGVTVARPDPFGLFNALNKVELPQTALILHYLGPPQHHEDGR